MSGSPSSKLRQQHSVPNSRNARGSILVRDNNSPRVPLAKTSSPSPTRPSVSFSNNRNQIKTKVTETKKSTPQSTTFANNATASGRMVATQSRIKLKVDVKLPGGDKPSTPRKTPLPTAVVAKSSARKPVAPPPTPPSSLIGGTVTPIKPKVNSSTSTHKNVTPTWNRNNNVAQRPTEPKMADKALDSRGDDVSTQTNEAEILNYSLLVGDVKFMKASKHVLIEIERQRNDYKTKQLLKTQRKFEQHSERQEEHISDLKEFLERSYVTRKHRKPRDTLEEDKRIITSMDQILNREIPKTESVTNIKARIKRKEQELLSLFDNVQNVRTMGNKN
ncbi:uncharacterized protein ACN2A1_002226 [Glossina fuscipes fuscipes]